MAKLMHDNKKDNKTLLEEIITSSPRLYSILNALSEKIKKGHGYIRIDLFCKLLDINIEKLSELLESEEINFRIDGKLLIIKVKKLKRLYETIEKIQHEKVLKKLYDKSLKELIINSEEFISILESDIETIRLSKIAKTLNFGVNHIRKLFEFENIIINSNPNTKVSCDLLKHLLLKEPESNFSTATQNVLKENIIDSIEKKDILNGEKLIILGDKIQNLNEKVKNRNVLIKQFVRNEYIREFAKTRANGFCELCDNPAPFKDSFGVPFLETHHVIFLSKGGQDNINNVVALCPNCHRKIHNLSLETDVEILLYKLKKHKLASSY